MMKKLLFLFLLLCLPLCAGAEETFALAVPETVHPYAGMVITVDSPEAGELALTVEDAYTRYEFARRQIPAGRSEIFWNGLMQGGEAARRGAYTVRAQMTGKQYIYTCDSPVRVLTPAAALQYCIPSDTTVYAGYEGFQVDYLVTNSCLIHIQLAEADAPDVILKTWSVEPSDSLPHVFYWTGQIEGRSVAPGEYILSFTVKNSAQGPIAFPVTVTDQAPPQVPVTVRDPALFLPETEADTWACLTAPVTVVNIGRLQHQSIMAQPTAKSTIIGTLHGQTHAVRVLEVREDGFCRVGTWRQEDGEYVEGYVPTHKLKTVIPNPHYGVVVDKKTQTLQIWQDGEKLGTLGVSTGLMAKGKFFRETLAGAFLTNDRIISFKDDGYQYNYAIRIDGGNLIHSMGCKLDGAKFDYSEQLRQIGVKASHGCVRVDPRPDENGLNMYWLWTHLPVNAKVLVLDDPEQRAARMAELVPATPAPVTPAPVTATPEPASAVLPAVTSEPTATPEPTPTPEPTVTPEPIDAPPYEGILSSGARGERVLQLQKRLAALGYYAGEQDGVFGGMTRDAVVAFQRANGLSGDGVVGQKTFAALWNVAAPAAPTQTPKPTATPSPAPTEAPTAAPEKPPEAAAESASAPPPTAAPTPPPETSVVISLAGDALIGSQDSVRKQDNSFDSVVAQEGYAYPLRNFAALFAADDITFINLETVLKDDSKDKTPNRLYNFRGPTAFAQILTEASVEHVNIANNHFIDYGYSGRRTTRAALEAAGVTYSGYTYTHIYEKDGVKIGFGGIRETTWRQDRTLPAKEIAALREAGCAYILYACHFGTEYDPNHNELQTQIAHAIIDAGADCIVGAHPHVVQGIEIYQGKPIFYSLGNFVFGGTLNPTDYDGLAAQLTLHFTHGACDGVSARLIPLMTSGVRDGTTDFCPVIAEGDDYQRILDRVQQDSEIEITGTMRFE